MIDTLDGLFTHVLSSLGPLFVVASFFVVPFLMILLLSSGSSTGSLQAATLSEERFAPHTQNSPATIEDAGTCDIEQERLDDLYFNSADIAEIKASMAEIQGDPRLSMDDKSMLLAERNAQLAEARRIGQEEVRAPHARRSDELSERLGISEQTLDES